MGSAVAEKEREITCPSCGQIRIVSARHARRAPKTCNLCRFPRTSGPDEEDIRFWLERLSDEEIVEIVWALWAVEIDPERIRRRRRELGCS